MKKFLSFILLSSGLALLWSCKKQLELIDPTTTTENFAFVKFVHASPNFRTVFKGADSFNVYVNDAKLNGSFLTYNSSFPTATTSSLYSTVTPGNKTIRLTLNGKNTPDSVTVATLTKTLEKGSYYSFIITDEALTANESRQMWLKDNVTMTDTSHFTLRFVNAVLNDPTAVDVYSYRQASNIFTGVAPGTATSFAYLNYILPSDTLYVRVAGTKTEITRIGVRF